MFEKNTIFNFFFFQVSFTPRKRKETTLFFLFDPPHKSGGKKKGLKSGREKKFVCFFPSLLFGGKLSLR